MLNKKKYEIFFYVSCASVLATLIFYKTNLNNDFSLYHGPFLSVIQNEKLDILKMELVFMEHQFAQIFQEQLMIY